MKFICTLYNLKRSCLIYQNYPSECKVCSFAVKKKRKYVKPNFFVEYLLFDYV